MDSGNAPLVPNEIPLAANDADEVVDVDLTDPDEDDAATSVLEDETLTSNRPRGVLRLLTDDLDVPNTIGSTGRSRRDTGGLLRMDSESQGSSLAIVTSNGVSLEAQEMRDSSQAVQESDCPEWMRSQWEVNYKEAAIFLEVSS